MFAAIYARLEKLSQYAVWLGGATLLAAALMVTVDVLARKIFNVTMSGSDEYSGYVFSATTTWAYSYCLLHRSNVRIDALYNLLPRRVTATLDVVGLAMLMYYMAYMTYYALVSFQNSWVSNSISITTLGTPQWIPQLFWVAGLVLFFATLIFVTVYALVALLQRNWDLVAKIAGVPSIAEVMEEETHGIDVVMATANAPRPEK
jgi:TRAP-type C4-dicarboxylate transport system permease small subunit